LTALDTSRPSQAHRRAWRALRTVPRPVLAALAIGALANITLAIAYLWSSGGQTFHARYEADGDTFTAFTDGRRSARGEFVEAPENGGIILRVRDTTTSPACRSRAASIPYA